MSENTTTMTTDSVKEEDKIEDLHVSISQVMTMTGLSAHGVKTYVTPMLEPAFKSGKFVFYKREDVQSFVQRYGPLLEMLKPKTRKSPAKRSTDAEGVKAAESVLS